MTFLFDDQVGVFELQELMQKMSSDQSGKFPAEAVFHIPLRNVEKEAEALKYGINVTARDAEGNLVGYMRVISDRSYIHYIVDVMVDPKFQGQRIGSEMVKAALKELKKSGFIKILLTAIPGKEDFYKRMGFQETMSPVLALRGEDYQVVD